jgi:MSHA biogenesis protein MshP
MSIRRRRFSQPGFALPSAIFLLVILSGLAAWMVSFTTTQSATSAQDVLGSRAYHAARAALEWNVYQVLDPTNATVPATIPPGGWTVANGPGLLACPSAGAPTSIEGFNITLTCTRYPSATDYYTESGTVRAIAVYDITATASMGTPGSFDRIERQINIRVSKCRSTEGTAPSYACP